MRQALIHVIKRTFQTPKKKPVIISYTANGKRYEKAPDEADLRFLRKLRSPHCHLFPIRPDDACAR